ncbi:MAG: heavy metal translocating P-type ATPase [Deltaproteobacteria bacterium]|nr:MAG: heavy metal translocating P-type ATPase [Deltaproteobacteria bacterium]
MDAVNADIPVRINKKILKKFGVRVKQSMSGRIRVRVKSLERRAEQAGWMKERLRLMKGVRQVETRFATGSVIVVFEEKLISTREILTEIVVQILKPAVHTQPEKSPAHPAAADSCECRSKRSFSSKLFKVGWLSGVMLYSAVRYWVFKLPLVQTPLGLIGIAATVGTMSLVREAVSETLQKERVTVKPFLAFGSISTILMGEPFSALQIIWIYNVAELTEDYVALKSRKAIRDILEVAPANAYVMIDGVEVETAVSDILPDDIVAVHTGEKIPVDGRVVDGEALVDEASINGRSEAVFHGIGDEVWAGTIISQGVLLVKTVKTGEDTYLAHIMKMVENSLNNKAPVEQKADQLASRLLKIGLAATTVTFLLTLDPMRALTVMLVMSCPCATVLAASSAVTAAVANAAKRSILIKGGLYLEKIGEADVYCFDKTGTLTMEQPEIVSITGRVPSISEEAILTMAATAESHNQHPMARAILAEAKARGIVTEPHAVCDFRAGRGVFCTVGGDAVILVGNSRFMDEHEVDISWFAKKETSQLELGHTVVYVAKNGKAKGMLGVANPVRPEAVKVLHALKEDGVARIELVTGDNTEIAESLMAVFPFDDCRADLRPEQKAERVDELRENNAVVMVGDGVNDALALTRADIGVAMGAGGAEVAMEAADIALADSDLEGLMKVRNLSHQTLRVVDQNHYLAVSTDLIGAALGMMGILSPIMAGMIHILHTGGILINSSRLLNWQPSAEPESSKP